MSDVIRSLYESRVYPAMSHPLSDPAVSSVAAWMGGLEVPVASGARVLEIGCCSGHNLIPLAMRWPDARFTGVDLSVGSISRARELAAIAGVENIGFHAADLRNYRPDGDGFDFIIAHGFLSWVPDEVKSALFAFCGRHLSASGVCTISFNLEAGWKRRMPVIRKVRAIHQAGAADEWAALGILRAATPAGSPELEVIDDMLAKGPDILAFDDFGPVNDPWPLDRFVCAANDAGLQWLGESDPGKNIPRNIADERLDQMRRAAADPLAFQCAIDEESARTFRSGLLCRADAPLAGGFSLARVFDLHGRAWDEGAAVSENPLDVEIFGALAALGPCDAPLSALRPSLPHVSPRDLAQRLHDGIMRGWLLARTEGVVFNDSLPEFPALDPFRLECVRRRLPVVDSWHRPCQFPGRQYEILELFDGSRSLEACAVSAARLVPGLDFHAWLRHLCRRGMFV